LIPDAVLDLIRSSIKSAWALELLLFIRRQAARSWTVDELTAELRSSPSLVTSILTSLKKSNLVQEEPEGSFRYAPATAELDDLVRQLDEINAERPLALIKEIISAPNDKLISFVDAFKLRKDKD
jgi:DNA-binding IscR family transcriptional regulator